MENAEFEIRNGSDLDVSPDRAFALLTDPAQLRRWFAEEVHIDPRPGGAFAFAGRGAYAPTSTTLTMFDPGRAIGWDWPIHGVTGRVEITVSPREGDEASRIDVTCTFAELPPVPRGRELADDLWRFHIGALKALTENEMEVALPDFGDPAPEVRQSIHIDAPRASVFRALTDPVLLAGWTFGKPDVDLREGGRYSYGWEYDMDGRTVLGGPTRILEMERDVRLVTDWPDWRGDDTNNGQRITWLLEDEGSGTRLTLVHDGFGRASDISDFPFGWNGFLDLIKGVVVGTQA